MSIRLLIVTATEVEADSLKNIPGIKIAETGFTFGQAEISLLIGGVGAIHTSWAMTKWLSVNQKPDLALNIGIAGTYSDEINIGDVVVPAIDCFADAGIETRDGFMTLSEAGLSDPDGFPFVNGKIEANNRYISLAAKMFRLVRAITVNTATGSEQTREKLLNKYNPDIESMEGATFFYICSREKIPFLAIRSISNRVEPRNKKNWNIPLALVNLSERLGDFLLMLD